MMTPKELFDACPETFVYIMVFIPILWTIGICIVQTYMHLCWFLIPLTILFAFIAGWMVHTTYMRERW